MVANSIATAATGDQTYVTQGDANPQPDEKPVMPVQVRGKVWYSVPFIGWANSAINGENRAWIVPLIAVALFLYAGYMFASGLASTIRKKRRAKSA